MVSPDTVAPVSPPVIITSLQGTSAEEGESARFQCRVTGDGKAQPFALNNCETDFVFKFLISIYNIFCGIRKNSFHLCRSQDYLVLQR